MAIIRLSMPSSFSAGQGPLRGAVLIDTPCAVDVKSLQVSFYGEAEVEYNYTETEDGPNGQKVIKTRHFKKEKKFNKVKVTAAGTQIIPPGRHEFPFEINVPNDIPPSFKFKQNTTEAEIKYKVHAKVLKGALKSDCKSEKHVISIAPAFPAALPVQRSDTNKFLLGKGSSTVSVTHPYSAFQLGHPIKFIARVANDSKKDNKSVKGRLEQSIVLKSCESGVPSFHATNVISEFKTTGTGEQRETIEREIILETTNIPPTIKHPMIEISYRAKASAEYSFAQDPEVVFDTTLIPLYAAQSLPAAQLPQQVANYSYHSAGPSLNAVQGQIAVMHETSKQYSVMQENQGPGPSIHAHWQPAQVPPPLVAQGHLPPNYIAQGQFPPPYEAQGQFGAQAQYVYYAAQGPAPSNYVPQGQYPPMSTGQGQAPPPQNGQQQYSPTGGPMPTGQNIPNMHPQFANPY
ncbi:hypothetical protein DFS34DRAFT_681948 [Phlyctochytrium arcticum]|nr:hypothetical protein DFS34DRAFT_681948 [Phlyctochytrium arcticum]